MTQITPINTENNNAPIPDSELDRTAALDINNTPISKGTRLKCIDDVQGGDSGNDWDIKLDEVYVVDYIHDEGNLTFPMIGLVDSVSGPVFPERFLVLEHV